MLTKSQQFFRQIDLFGQSISLNLNGEDLYKTGGGGFLSCMIVAIVAIFFQSNIIDFLGKTNISADSQIVFEENPDRLKFTSDNFMFAVSIEQSTAFNTNPFFNISIKARTYVRLSNGTTIKYENLTNLIPCTLDRFQKIFDKYDLNFTDQYNQLGLSTWLCPDLNYSLTVGGRYSSEYLDFAKIEITDCKNDTSKNAYLTWHPSCASKDVMDKYLSSEGSYRIRIYMTNTVVNPSKPTDYIQGYLDDEVYFQFVPTKLSRQSDIFFKKYQIRTDQSLVPVFDDEQIENVFTKEPADFRDITTLGSPTDKQYIALYFRRSPYTKYITRQFQKVDDLLSYLGGFVNIVVVFLGFFVGFYNKQQYLIELANKVYDFNFDNSKNPQKLQNDDLVKQITQIKKKTQKFKALEKVDSGLPHKKSLTQPLQDDEIKIQVFNEESPHNSLNQKQMIKNTSSEIKSEFQKQQEEIISKLGFKSRKEYLTSQISQVLTKARPIQFTFKFLCHQMTGGRCFKDNTSILLMKAVDKINSDIDIYVILEKVKEINLLKELMLDKNQQILFNFAPKQVITLKDEKKLPSRVEVYTQKLTENSNQSMSVGNIAQLAMKKHTDAVKAAIPVSVKAYQKLYKAYDKINDPQKELGRVNHILIEKLGKEIRDIFEVSQFIDFDLVEQKLSHRVKYILRKKVKQMRQSKSKSAFKKDFDEESSDNVGLFSQERNKPEDSEILQREILFPHRNL
ncbi:unnamed protein product [Paramecium octaurelia]|uniref:Uncharacterized protein n=1 Tax=Paramecium octaurelia TaxID=43137 RepID=A0A8S1SN50_PAROT|nr:unnamed protein product [Paramecium octaurelia]